MIVCNWDQEQQTENRIRNVVYDRDPTGKQQNEHRPKQRNHTYHIHCEA